MYRINYGLGIEKRKSLKLVGSGYVLVGFGLLKILAFRRCIWRCVILNDGITLGYVLCA